jgi:methionyl aminopeptidase
MGKLVLKSWPEIQIMDEANVIVQETLDRLGEYVRPGITTLDLDALAEQCVRQAGATPAFKGYPHPAGGRDFPGTICASINDEIVHGIPSAARNLREGDIVSVDLGVIFRGYYGDGARTFPVGEVDEVATRLLRVTRESLDRGIEQARVGNRVTDIGHAVQSHVEAAGFSVVREFVGHGIGSQLHEEPQIPNFGHPGRRERLEEGMVLAIEPMVNAGAPEVLVSAEDGWTARTRDGSLSAHFELCVAVTANGPWTLGRVAATAPPKS